MVTIAPKPSDKSTNPNSASFRFSLSLTIGTIGAQLEIPIPQTRKISKVALRAILICVEGRILFTEVLNVKFY